MSHRKPLDIPAERKVYVVGVGRMICLERDRLRFRLTKRRGPENGGLLLSEPIDRRGFLARAVKWMIGAAATVVGIPVGAYVVGPSIRGGSRDEVVALGSAGSVEIGTPTLFKAAVDRTAGYRTVREDLSVYVKTEDGRDFVGLSNICTHLGCRVRWVEDRRQFYCPCHAGVFDEDGDVVSGPPPRPLDRYEITLEGDRLLVHLDGSTRQ